MNLQNLRTSPLFEGLSDQELQHLVDNAQPVSLRAGEPLMKQGEPGDCAYVVLEGGFEIQKQSGQSLIKIDVRKPGEVIGEMALLSNAPRSASVVALCDSKTICISQKDFENLLATNPSATLAVLNWVMARLSQNESLLHQQEKMAALGTMSAGLAHELNNPAAAAQRNASLLIDAPSKWLELTHQLETLAYEKGLTDWLSEFMSEATRRFENPIKLDALEKIDLVDHLQVWLEANGTESAWEFAPAMVNFGWSEETLSELKDSSLLSIALPWLGTGCMIMSQLLEIQNTTGRISQIVKAMKSYTYLDQAPILEVDVHEGLENTLVIMQHKLKQGVTVKREYTPDIPRIEAYASELNQVWTNIIDNAIDAMNGKGEIVLRTYQESDQIIVELIDNGPGIPKDVKTRIFEPFYTTKPPGQGTGLGLHVTHDIVVNRHHGQLLVESKPGKTKFIVILPKQIKGENIDE